jgi:ribosome maturation factor RimP
LQLEKIREAAERVARSEGLEVVDVEWKIGKQRFLRVYIDRVPGSAAGSHAGDSLDGDENGNQAASPYPKISHADCERVSKQLSVIFDVEDLVPGPGYVLEVSSPGMDRALKKAADYVRFTGRAAKVWTEEPVDDMKFFEGRLAGVVDDRVRGAVLTDPGANPVPGAVLTDPGTKRIRLELKGKTPRTVEVPLALIRKAHLVVEF